MVGELTGLSYIKQKPGPAFYDYYRDHDEMVY